MDSRRVNDPESSRHGASQVRRRTVLEGGVVWEDAGGERGGRARAGLIIRRFCLHHAEEDVFGIGQLVLIQDVVLRSCPPEPCRLAALNEYPFWGNIQMLDVSP